MNKTFEINKTFKFTCSAGLQAMLGSAGAGWVTESCNACKLRRAGQELDQELGANLREFN